MQYQLKNTVKILIHILIWGMLFAFSFIGMNESHLNLTKLCVPLIEAFIIFYLNYLFLVKYFIFTKRKYWLFIISNILIILFFRFDMQLFELFTGEDILFRSAHFKNGGVHDGQHGTSFSLYKSLLELIMPALLAFLIKSVELFKTIEINKKEIENVSLQSELAVLKYQLHPHFFFNSLNNIYALVDLSPAKAKKMIHDLSKFMYYLLRKTNDDKVDLAEEINFLKRYVQIMEVRLSDDIIMNCDFPEINPNQYRIAPLLLIPIIENAYKHGISASKQSLIAFELSIADNRLSFVSINSNYPKPQSDIRGSGIGLENLKKRLTLIYPDKHKLDIEIKEDMFHLSLIIELV